MLCNHNYRTKLKILNAVYNFVHFRNFNEIGISLKKQIIYTEKYHWRNQKFVQNYLQEDHRPESTVSVLSNYKVTNHSHAS